MNIKHIGDHMYERIKRVMPIPCVDFVLHNGNTVLLCKRANQPAQGEWWLPGGRVLRDEKAEDAAVRKAFEELGVEVVIERLVGVYDNIFDSVHCFTVVYLVRLAHKNVPLRLDEQHSEYKFVDTLAGLHPYIAQEIKDSKVFGRGK